MNKFSEFVVRLFVGIFVLVLVCGFISIACKSEHQSAFINEKGKKTEFTTPPGAEIVQVLDNNWCYFKLNGEYFLLHQYTDMVGTSGTINFVTFTKVDYGVKK